MEKPLELNMMIIRKQMSVLVFLTSAFLSTWTTLGDTAEIPKGQRLDIGYAPVTGNRILLWVAQDMGFFAQQGLATRLIYLASSSQGIPALVSGQIPIFSGSPETAAQAAANGAGLVIVASAAPDAVQIVSSARHRWSRRTERQENWHRSDRKVELLRHPPDASKAGYSA